MLLIVLNFGKMGGSCNSLLPQGRSGMPPNQLQATAVPCPCPSSSRRRCRRRRQCPLQKKST